MRILPTLVTLLLWSGRLTAQVDVEILLPQEQFLRDEPLLVKVRIVNRSGQTLKLGETNDWLKFGVDISGHGPAGRAGQPALASPFELESARQAVREVDIQPWFEISQPGQYTISATVRIPQWDRELSARPKAFEIVRGARLWDQEVGVPAAAGAAGQPEVRHYILQQANYRKQLKLYLRLSNEADTYAFAVLPLGPLVSFGRPEAQVDEQSNLHVLFQTGARSFLYSMITPGGVLTTRQNYEYAATRPTLKLNEAGKIAVTGGVRRMASTDLPAAATPTPLPTDSPTPKK